MNTNVLVIILSFVVLYLFFRGKPTKRSLVIRNPMPPKGAKRPPPPPPPPSREKRMSLELSKPKVTVKSHWIRTDATTLYASGFIIDINHADMCALIEYVLTNTDLEEEDPRIDLLERLKGAEIVESPSSNKQRIKF